MECGDDLVVLEDGARVDLFGRCDDMSTRTKARARAYADTDEGVVWGLEVDAELGGGGGGGERESWGRAGHVKV